MSWNKYLHIKLYQGTSRHKIMSWVPPRVKFPGCFPARFTSKLNWPYQFSSRSFKFYSITAEGNFVPRRNARTQFGLELSIFEFVFKKQRCPFRSQRKVLPTSAKERLIHRETSPEHTFLSANTSGNLIYLPNKMSSNTRVRTSVWVYLTKFTVC